MCPLVQDAEPWCLPLAIQAARGLTTRLVPRQSSIASSSRAASFGAHPSSSRRTATLDCRRRVVLPVAVRRRASARRRSHALHEVVDIALEPASPRRGRYIRPRPRGTGRAHPTRPPRPAWHRADPESPSVRRHRSPAGGRSSRGRSQARRRGREPCGAASYRSDGFPRNGGRRGGFPLCRPVHTPLPLYYGLTVIRYQ